MKEKKARKKERKKKKRKKEKKARKHHEGSERKRKYKERQGDVLPRSGFYPKVATPQPHLVVKIIVSHSFFTTLPSPLTSEAETVHQ